MTNDGVSDDNQDIAEEARGEVAGEDSSPKRQRDRSTVRFPYSGLADVVQVAEVMFHHYGGRCSPDQLAATLNQTTSSGAFRIKVSTAQLVGAIEVHRGVLSLTDLGNRLANEETRPQALVEAFLNVELYERIFTKYQGQRLPRDAGLEADMVGIGVAPKQAGRARQAFQRSAEVAGFFWQGRDRLVLPPSGQADTLAAMGTTKSSGSASLGGEPTTQEPDVLRGRHPLIVGLFRELPTEDTDFPAEKRQVWLGTAAAIFSLVWGKAEAEPEAESKSSASEDRSSAST